MAAALALAPSAPAQTPEAEQKAEALFREGREAVRTGDHALGCTKFEESLALLERASTFLNLAACKEQLGKLTAAISHWRKGAELLPAGDERVAFAKERIGSLERRLPHLVVRLDASAPAGTKVFLDGAELGADALGADQAIDPGYHVLIVTAEGRLEQKSSIRLAETERREVVLAPGPDARSGTVGPKATQGAQQQAGAQPTSSRRTIGFIVGGVGLASLAAAGVTGLMVMGNDSTIEEQCPDARCSQEGIDEVDSSRTLLVVNAITAGVGIVGLGVGAVLVLTAPSASETGTRVTLRTSATPGGAGLSLGGAF